MQTIDVVVLLLIISVAFNIMLLVVYTTAKEGIKNAEERYQIYKAHSIKEVEGLKDWMDKQLDEIKRNGEV